MTPETKEMRSQTQSKEVISNGPVVATQWPTIVRFTEDEKSAVEMAEKYVHLKQIDPDDKEAYKELKLAITDAKNKRLDIGKQENVIKEPLNKYRALLINTSKKIQALFGDIEGDLKKEKTRIDDIREERKLAQRKLWQDNLDSLREMSSGLQQMSREDLDLLSESLHDFDFDALDFGEYIEQAKSTLAIGIEAINDRIVFMVEQQRLADEKAAFERKRAEEVARLKRLDDERIKREAEIKRAHDEEAMKRVRENNMRIARENDEKKKRDEEKAESDRKQAESDAENQRLRDQVAAMQKANETVEFETPKFTALGENVHIHVDAGDSDSTVEAVVEVHNGEIVNIIPVAGRASAIQQEPETTVTRETVQEPENDSMSSQREPEEIARENDYSYISSWAYEVSNLIDAAPKGIVDAKAAKAVEEVSEQLEAIYKYLCSKASDLKG